MIKVKSIGYQKDNVAATVEYDLEGQVYSFTVYAKVLQVAKMTDVEIKEYIKGRVSAERDSKVKGAVESLLNALIGIDLEES